MNGVDLVRTTGDAAFITDRQGLIRAWNPSAEEYFGVCESEVVGRPCWEVLRGSDSFGNEYCSRGCPLMEMALQGKKVNRCQLQFKNADGEMSAYSVALLLLQGLPPVDPALVHLIHPVFWERRTRTKGKSGFKGNHDRGELTKRELEVLSLLAMGQTTREIATTLRISQATARNHIQHILHKLHCHTRLEAVAVGRKARLIQE
jgi:PAS domain S-box-containing protein